MFDKLKWHVFEENVETRERQTETTYWTKASALNYVAVRYQVQVPQEYHLAWSVGPHRGVI